MAPTYTGSCKCGSIQLELEGEPDVAALCHCNNCRKSTGSAFSTNAVFKKTHFTLTAGQVKEYEAKGGSGRPAYVAFCDNCSSTMWTTTPSMPDIIVIKVGILDGDAFERIAPKAETFTARKPSWLKSVDGAAQFPETYAPPSAQ